MAYQVPGTVQQSHFNKQPLSPLYLADKTNLIDIMEIVSGLFLSKRRVSKWQACLLSGLDESL